MFLFWMIMLSFPLFLSASGQALLDTANPEKTVKELPSYPYPYKHLAKELASQGKTTFKLFSYGSLLDKDSARRTLSDKALSTRRASIAFGVKRVFDRDVPIKPDSHWGIPNDPKARGMLNLLPADFEKQFVNGVVIEIPVDEIDALLIREEGYDLKPVLTADWEAFLQGKIHFEISYTLMANPKSTYVSQEVYPRPGYYELTRNAAEQFGPLFILLWLNTTYLADGKTSILQWEQLLKEKDPKTGYQRKLP